MATNTAITRVARKELALFFSSPVAWLFLTGFAITTGFVFFWVESFFARNIADVRPLFEWMPLLLIFFAAAITMRMWSDERRTGTLEHILTLPVGLWRFVLGKFLACLALLVLALLSTAAMPTTVSLIADLDPGPVFAGYLASLLLGAAYISIGLYVSARTDNPITSLLGTVTICGVLYLVGSNTLTGLFDNHISQTMRLLASGARFNSITRGVLDLTDLCYYLSLCIAFIALNIHALERERWSRGLSTVRHRQWRMAIVLLLTNLIVFNALLQRTPVPRLDLTQGRQYSLSEVSKDFLSRLQEPLLLRAYLSERTHPLLAPLEPQLRDLMHEFEEAGTGRVRVEFVDPAQEPELEEEANQRYGISATPFQVANRHQATLVNGYFNLLVQYGTEHEALGFADLIEVHTSANSQPEVQLGNPEYVITRAIRDVLSRYRSGGDLFQGIERPVELIGYVSADELLPDRLLTYKDSIVAQLENTVSHSGGKLTTRFIEPEAAGGTVARKIGDQWGFKPMVMSLGEEQEFFFYLTLADEQQVVQLPTENFDPGDFRRSLDSGLKRFASGFTKTVALSLPAKPEGADGLLHPGPTFRALEREITRDHSLLMENLEDGTVSPEADILAVIAPKGLQQQAVFAIDQFLMRGGTVVLATSPFSATLNNGDLVMQDWNSGLGKWLAHLGVEVEPALVLDSQNAPFPAPTHRQSGDYEFRDLRMIDYPYFVDLREGGMDPDHPITAGIRQVTMAWASPVIAPRNNQYRVGRLLWSSDKAWQDNSKAVMPSTTGDEQVPRFGPAKGVAQQSADLALMLQGRFNSYFANPARSAPSTESELANAEIILNPVEHSPESARLIVFASNDFLSDRVMNAIITASGTQSLGPLELFSNTLDWALQDDELLNIRARGHFNRTLPPMEREAQVLIEYFNYGMAALFLLLLGSLHWLVKLLRRRYYTRGLQL